MYYPKNQIQTGFYSNNSLAELATNKPYNGPYFNTSDGKSFSGKEPNDGPNLELIPLPNPTIKRKPTPAFDEGDELGNQDPGQTVSVLYEQGDETEGWTIAKKPTKFQSEPL